MGKPQLLRYEEWCGGSGDRWYCNDTSDFTSVRGLWWVPAALLEVSVVDFVKLLIEKFEVDYISYNKDKNVLVYSWKSQAKMRVYKNYINKVARDKKFII